MVKSSKPVPVVDIFAGPGGLSEGFGRHANWSNSDISFQSVLSIEKEEVAVKTLTLRTFYRQFDDRPLPSEYWQVVKGQAQLDVLHKFPEWRTAEEHVWRAELGKVALDDLHRRISERLDGADDWLLLGGPPCQAYSLIGRARMTGIGFEGRKDAATAEATRVERLAKFRKDVRHKLYREYLRIIAVHQPTLFVMENVKGILSAKVPDEDGNDRPMFDRIREDLTDPWFALQDDDSLDDLTGFARPGRPRYRLHAFVDRAAALLADDPPRNEDFLIRSEQYGVPQRRHRVIVLGIREDVEITPGKLARQPEVSVRDAIGTMPALRSGLSRGEDTDDTWKDKRAEPFTTQSLASLPSAVKAAIQSALGAAVPAAGRGAPFLSHERRKRKNSVLETWLLDPELLGIVQHQTRGHMDSDLGRYLFAAASATALGHCPKLEEWPPFLLPAHRNVTFHQKTGIIESFGFSDRFKVQMWDEPSSTITSHISKDGHYFIHPDPAQGRSLTVREAARLQTFPDDYYFCGNRTEQYQQVGNAVPPLLAVQLADIVARVFGLMRKHRVSPRHVPAEAAE